ncbi:ATP-dependent endonuclease [Bradyrhizobium sp. USDA 328]|uniref:ATP-dependent nuclease n=1 Tax=Bradyrhizobium sp. USDA 328 TaxID=3156309 RepID=UPI00351351DF
MKISHLSIENFRGIRKASVLLPDHAVLIGDNNVGKSTILEALDLVMGPDRLSRQSPIDEHDFHLGQYLASETSQHGSAPHITIAAVVTGLSEEQQIHFRDYIEWWDTSKHKLSEVSAPVSATARCRQRPY